MKKQLLLLLFFILFATVANAETYTVEKPDGSIVLATYFENSKDSLEQFLASTGLGGLPYYKIDPSTFPSKADRKYWKRQGGRIVVDTVRKQADLDAQAQKEAEKDAVLTKLKISRQEADLLRKI